MATSCEELTHWKRLWCWEGLGAGGEGDDRGWDGWMASLTWWTWVWVNSWSWWWTGRPGVLWFRGSQRVGHGWATELNWIITNVEHFLMCLLVICISLGKCLFSSAYFSIRLGFCCWNCLCILESKSLPVSSFANTFSHSVELCFCFAYDFLCCAKSLYVWLGPICFYFHCLRMTQEKTGMIYVRTFCLYSFSFIVSCLSFWSCVWCEEGVF